VAYYISRNIFKGRKRQLVIEPEGESNMDAIVVAFTVLDKIRRDQQAAASSSAAASGS
jgi:hypothetical protein